MWAAGISVRHPGVGRSWGEIYATPRVTPLGSTEALVSSNRGTGYCEDPTAPILSSLRQAPVTDELFGVVASAGGPTQGRVSTEAPRRSPQGPSRASGLSGSGALPDRSWGGSLRRTCQLGVRYPQVPCTRQPLGGLQGGVSGGGGGLVSPVHGACEFKTRYTRQQGTGPLLRRAARGSRRDPGWRELTPPALRRGGAGKQKNIYYQKVETIILD